MRILIDECIDRRFVRELKGHYARTVPQMGWAAITNGRLLALAEKEFDVFITVDRNLSFQQSLPKFHVAVLVLRARTNTLSDLKPLVPQILKTLSELPKRQATYLG